MNVHYRRLFILFTMISCMSTHAKFYQPGKFEEEKIEKKFDTYIKRHTLAVVHFNPLPEEAAEDFPLLDRMRDAFFSLSKEQRYKDADVAFIELNVADAPDVAQDYKIEVPDWQKVEEQTQEAGAQQAGQVPDIKESEMSTVMLFKNGQPLQEDSRIVRRTGLMTKTELEDFIEKYFANDIDQTRAAQRKEEQQKETVRRVRYLKPQQTVRQVTPTQTRTVYREVEVPRYRYYSRPYRYSYRPYGYYGRWGRPWGYRRRWWGPGFGVGFGFGRRRGGFGFGIGW